LKQFRKDPSFEKFDLTLIYPSTQDAVQHILKDTLVEQPINSNNISNPKSNISFYQENLILKDGKSNSSISGESNTDKEDISHLSNSSGDVV